MPQASTPASTQIKYSWKDHDTAEQLLNPPVLNQWYTVFDSDDVRLLIMTIYQKNTEAAAKDVEIKWTIDGTTYFCTESLTDDTTYWIYRIVASSSGGTTGLRAENIRTFAFDMLDKRGLKFKVETRIITALGTAQSLKARAVYETLEAT
jgi:hypothetical protein